MRILFLYAIFLLTSNIVSLNSDVLFGLNSFGEEVLLFENSSNNEKNIKYMFITDRKEFYQQIKESNFNKYNNLNCLYIGEKRNNFFTSKNGVVVNFNFDVESFLRKTFYISKTINCGNAPFSEVESQYIKRYIENYFEENKKVVLIYITNGEKKIVIDNDMSLYYANKIFGKNNIHYVTNFSGSMSEWLYSLRIPTIYLRVENIKELDKYSIHNISIEKYDNNEIERIFDSSISKSINNILINDSYSENDREAISKIKMTFRKSDLLPLVNKKNMLEADYIPEGLINVDKLIKSQKSNLFLKDVLIDDLMEMYNDALSNNLKLFIVSAYRSFETQKIVYDRWVKIYGSDYANKVSAKAGFSQHQLGVAIDFNSLETNFESTREGVWLMKKAYEFGFILSYPKGQEDLTGYNYEPWHYRYVGRNQAFVIYNYFRNNLELFLQWYWHNSDIF